MAAINKHQLALIKTALKYHKQGDPMKDAFESSETNPHNYSEDEVMVNAFKFVVKHLSIT